MYFINPIIAKTIANEIYREAGYDLTHHSGWYTIYDREPQTDDEPEHDIAFCANKDKADEMFKYNHFTICVNECKNGEDTYEYYATDTLNRRELADKILEIIKMYEHLKQEVTV